MKKYFFLILLGSGLFLNASAQELQTIPQNAQVRSYADGWYKFQLQGVIFDVEIMNGDYTQGNIIWLDGTTYSGSLSNIDIAGRGTYTWSDGSRYEGSFRGNKLHGKGTLIHIDGSKWSGKWKNGMKNGKGKLFDTQGVVIQQGVWENNELVEARK